MQTNNQNSNSPINPKLGSSVTNAIKNAEAGELPALDDISNITNRVVEKIKASENILIALSKNPNIDEISAALGLAMILDTMRKHVTAIFSGQVPNVLQFLKPEETFEKTTNSLQDFIIALSKDKVDHISYKIEGDFVKVYVTPYKATIGQSDLSMSHGDYNVDLVICFNVISGDEIDPALSEYGRIMHDATAINLTVDTPGRFAELEWQDSNVSSISEMIVGLADKLGLASFSEQVATALLTGIVASTDHFSNPRTSSNTMSIASKLMSFGANQQLISSQIMEKIKTPATPAVTVGSAPVESISVSDSPLDYIEIEPNPNQTLDGQPLESQSTPAIQSFESQISPITQPQEPQPVSQPAPVSQSFESQPTSAPQTIESQSAPIPQSLEPQQAPVYQAPINPAAAAASAVMENNFIQNPEPSLPQPNYTNETPNYQAPVMPTPPLNFAQNLATPQPSSTPFAAPVSLAAPTPLATSAPLTQTASPVTSIPQEQPMQYSAPVQPVQPIQPTQYVQPTQYPEPASPVQPMQFTAPVSQAQSMPYVEPMQPTPMAAPSEPVQFTQPVQPMAPVPPVQPMEPMQSMPPVPPAPMIFDAASMPNQPLTNDQAFVNPAPVDLMPPMPPMPPEAPSTPDVDFFAQAAAATEAAQANPAPISPVASGPIPADLDPVSTPAPAPLEVPAEPPLRTFASESPLISQPIDTSAPIAAPITEPAAIFSPEEPTEPAPAKIDPTAFHIPGM
ncbi:MAG: hypothetical protein NNC33_01730 [Candidatus Nanosyncoccus sp. P13S_S20_bin.18.1]|nr:hypothetical protein [Candidatus Nanosyncoccus sp. P13S_S20_bin.18.1]